MPPGQYKIVSGAQDRELVARGDAMVGGEWPEFMLHDPVAENFSDLYEKFPEYQFVLMEDALP